MNHPAFTLLSALLFSAAPILASAQLTANIALTSNYKFRGQDQDMLSGNRLAKDSTFKPAIQGGLDYSFGESGFYVGNWNSSVNWLPGNSIEMDFYGGYKMTVGSVGLDFGALTYQYPGNTSGNTTELYSSASHSSDIFGSAVLKYSHTVSRDYFNFAGAKSGSGLSGRNTGYLNGTISRPLMDKVNLKASLGYTRLSGDIRSLGYKSYADYSVGGAYDFGAGLTLLVAVQGANRQASYATPSDGGVGQTYSPNKTRLILTISKTL